MGKWAYRPWGQELANVIKRTCIVLVRIWKGPRLGKWASRPWAQELATAIKRMCDISIRVRETPQIRKNGPGGPGLKK